MQSDSKPTTTVARSRRTLAYMITASIVLSLGLVVFSMYLYNESGAAQLDLSRPGYQDVRGRVQQPVRFDGFDATGELDEASLKKFDQLYQQQQDIVRKNSAGFNPFAIDNERLDIHVE